MKPIHKLTVDELSLRVDEYFDHLKNNNRPKKINKKSAESKTRTIKSPDPEPLNPTITGLAHFTGFNSRVQFNKYVDKGKFSKVLQRALLRIESVYEQRLHQHSTSGAIFVLKSMGWTDSKISNVIAQKSLNIKIIESGPQPATNEKEVTIEDQFDLVKK